MILITLFFNSNYILSQVTSPPKKHSGCASAPSFVHNVTLLFHACRCDVFSPIQICVLRLSRFAEIFICLNFYELILLVTPESHSNSQCSVKGYVLQKILALYLQIVTHVHILSSLMWADLFLATELNSLKTAKG